MKSEIFQITNVCIYNEIYIQKAKILCRDMSPEHCESQGKLYIVTVMLDGYQF